MKIKSVRFILSICGLFLMAKGAFAQGFGEVREAEARLESEAREKAKVDLMQTIRSLDGLRTMPGRPGKSESLLASNLSADQVTGVFVTFADGRVYFYDYITQFKGLVRLDQDGDF